MKIRFGAAIAILTMAAPLSSAATAGGPVPSLPWLHEGLVLTFTWYAAQAAGNGSDYAEDENGGWIDRATGRRLARTPQQGTSGSGWTQVTVTCIDGDRVAVVTNSFANAGALGNNQPVPQNMSESAIAPVADPGEYWMDPAKLATLHSVPAQRILVTRVAWRVSDRATDAIRVQVIKDGNYSEHVYDAKTGLCLHFASSARGPAPKYVGPGDMGKGDTTLTHGDFVRARDISVPWAHEAMPDWIGRIHALHYRGPVISRGPLPSTNTVYFADLQFVARGAGWAEAEVTLGTQTPGLPRTPPGTGKLVSGRNQFAGLWAGPQALAGLQRGQVLDEDPVTKMRTVVAKIDDRTVVISQRNAAGEVDSEYDRQTGMVTASSFFNVFSKQQWTLRLQGRE